MAQHLFTPLYRLEVLISQKVITTNLHRREIIRQIEEILDVSASQFRRIRSAQQGQPGYLSVAQLQRLADYFQVPIDDLINRTSSSASAAGPEGKPTPAALSPDHD